MAEDQVDPTDHAFRVTLDTLRDGMPHRLIVYDPDAPGVHFLNILDADELDLYTLDLRAVETTIRIHDDCARVERECMALHSALAEALHRLGSQPDLLAVLDDPAQAPRPWESSGRSEK